MFHFRPALPEDLPQILDIYENARAFMRQSGNPNQWRSHHPAVEILKDDIQKGQLYLCMEGDDIAAVFCYFQGIDPTYLRIDDGQWLNDDPYGVIHRIASTGKFPRMVEVCTEWCLDRCPSLKIDTHRDNAPMRSALDRCGFTYCGVIVIDDGSERVAYQKTK